MVGSKQFKELVPELGNQFAQLNLNTGEGGFPSICLLYSPNMVLEPHQGGLGKDGVQATALAAACMDFSPLSSSKRSQCCTGIASGRSGERRCAGECLGSSSKTLASPAHPVPLLLPNEVPMLLTPFLVPWTWKFLGTGSHELVQISWIHPLHTALWHEYNCIQVHGVCTFAPIARTAGEVKLTFVLQTHIYTQPIIDCIKLDFYCTPVNFNLYTASQFVSIFVCFPP